MAILSRLRVPGTAAQWTTLGFACGPDGFMLGHTFFEIGAAHMAWGFDRIDGDPEAFGVPTFVAEEHADSAPDHANQITDIDHVVYVVPDLDAAIGNIESSLGLKMRRRAKPRGPQGPEMAFFRAGSPVLEVVGRAGGNGSFLSGVAFLCADLDKTVAAMRETEAPVGDPKPAVQGGRIASVWREFTGMPIAIMEPPAR